MTSDANPGSVLKGVLGWRVPQTGPWAEAGDRQREARLPTAAPASLGSAAWLPAWLGQASIRHGAQVTGDGSEHDPSEDSQLWLARQSLG